MFTIDFPADTSVLGKIGNLVAEAGCNAGFSADEIGDIQLAVDEACTNTIFHGLKQDSSRRFQLAIDWKKGEIEILIREIGVPFVPMEVPSPDLQSRLENRPVGGLGVYFIRQLMDDVEFGMGQWGEKTLRMVKRK